MVGVSYSAPRHASRSTLRSNPISLSGAAGPSTCCATAGAPSLAGAPPPAPPVCCAPPALAPVGARPGHDGEEGCCACCAPGIAPCCATAGCLSAPCCPPAAAAPPTGSAAAPCCGFGPGASVAPPLVAPAPRPMVPPPWEPAAQTALHVSARLAAAAARSKQWAGVQRLCMHVDAMAAQPAGMLGSSR